MTSIELDMILTLEWPRVLRGIMGDSKASDFSKSFARSIARHGKRPAWHPTQKQERLMRDLLSQYGRNPEPEFDLIERE